MRASRERPHTPSHYSPLTTAQQQNAATLNSTIRRLLQYVVCSSRTGALQCYNTTQTHTTADALEGTHLSTGSDKPLVTT